MDVLTVLDVLIEPNAAALVVDGNSLVAALENIELVPSGFFVSRYFESLEQITGNLRWSAATTRVFALDCAYKLSSEGQRLNKLIRQKNVEGFLP